MKTSPALTCSSGEEQALDSVISTEHRSLTMEWGLSWVFLVAILKGDLWRTGDTECVSGHE
jgi:hypothetical protein